MASRISASVTATIARPGGQITAKVRSPTEVVRRPSAIVLGSSQRWIVPVSSDRRASSALAGSAAITRVGGECPSTASAVPASRPPPPTGQITRSSVAGLFQQLQRRRPLAGDHVPVVERMNERESMVLDLGGDGRLARSEGRLAEDDPRTIALGGRALDGRGGPRHDDGDRHTDEPAGQSQRLRVIARRMGDHAGPRAASSSCKTAFIAPRNLNAPTCWKFSHLKKHRSPSAVVEGLGGHHRRLVGPGAEPLGRLADVGKSDRDRLSFSGMEVFIRIL